MSAITTSTTTGNFYPIRDTKSSVTDWLSRKLDDQKSSIYATIIGMTSSYHPVANDATAYQHTPDALLDKRWERIMSFAGAFKDDPDFTIEKFFAFREAVVSARLDALHDLDDDSAPSDC